MITVIKNYSLDDVKDSIKYLLNKSAESLEVRQLAIEITVGSHDQISAIHDFVRDTVKYIPDPVTNGSIELFTSPIKMVKDYRAGITIGEDCDGIAVLTTALYRSVGIRARVVLIDQSGDGLDHAYCEVFSDKLGQWINSDPSAPLPLGWVIPYRQKIVI